jgi:hypothetical protein
VQQRRGHHQHTTGNQSDPAPAQLTCEPANVVCHYRASHHWLANVVLFRLALLIAASSGC